MATWDKRSAHAQHKLRDTLIREQLRDGIGPFSPYWRERFAALRLNPTSIRNAKDLQKIPPAGESDVCADGDALGAAALVLRGDETGFAMHSYGPDLRKALLRRVTGKATYRRQVEAAIRPTTYHFAGQAATFPIASTRGDLDLMARAGARAWNVLGLTSADVLVSAVPVAQRLDHVFLTFAALGAGAPALFPREDQSVRLVAETLDLVPATVLAFPSHSGSDVVAELSAAGVDFTKITKVLLVGTPDEAERALTVEALAAAGARATTLALYGPAEGRVLWAECAAGSGFHTYPDLDHIELVEPASGEQTSDRGEIVVTQLGFRGSALVRWRTGDVVDAPIETGACQHCKRTVPRIPSRVRHAGMLAPLTMRGRSANRPVDLRAIASALAGRDDLADWRVETGPSERDGHDELIVLVVPLGDETNAAVGAYQDIRAAAGVAPTQVVVLDEDEFADRQSTRAGIGPRH